MASTQRFSGYPRAREGPQRVTTHTEEVNPVLRGWSLVLAAKVVTKVSFVAKAIWVNAKFGTIKDMPELDAYDYRLNPIVTPISTDGNELARLEFTPELFPRQPDNLAGRFYSATDYHELYKSGKLTPLQVAEALIPLISRKKNSKYSAAWTETREDAILAAAKASTRRYQEGNPLGMLDGVPIGVKDDTAIKGYTCLYGQQPTHNDPAFAPAKESVWPVAQLEAAGAMVMGLLAMHELGADVTGCNPRRGSPKNWYNTSYYPGGSSSGGGSALAAGLIPITIGTDAGGSLRVPASFCGQFGLKPTLHRTHTSRSCISVTGPLAATATDLAIAYRAMTAPNPDDAIQCAFSPSIPPSPTAKKTIGICQDWIDQSVPAVRECMTKAIAYFSDKLNYDIVNIRIPFLYEGQLAHSAWALAESYDHLRTRFGERALSTINHANQMLLAVGACTTATDMMKYSQLRALHMEHLAFLFQKYPGLLIVTPTVPEIGWKVTPGDENYGFNDGNQMIRFMLYVWLANAIGCPAASAPMGYVEPEQGKGKVPVGIMAMGDWGAEEQLLAWTAEVEGYLNGVLEGGRQRPKEWVDVVELAGKVVEVDSK